MGEHIACIYIYNCENILILRLAIYCDTTKEKKNIEPMPSKSGFLWVKAPTRERGGRERETDKGSLKLT